MKNPHNAHMNFGSQCMEIDSFQDAAFGRNNSLNTAAMRKSQPERLMLPPRQ